MQLQNSTLQATLEDYVTKYDTLTRYITEESDPLKIRMAKKQRAFALAQMLCIQWQITIGDYRQRIA